MENSDARKKSKIIVKIGIAVITAFLTPFLLIGILYWMVNGFTIDDIQYVFLVFICAGLLGTSFHLWSRAPLLSGQIKSLFTLMGITFSVMILAFFYLILDVILAWYDLPTITAALNDSVPEVVFNVFDIEGLKITMPADSLVLFAIIIISISFYLFPMEKYAKQKFPWHTVSLLLCVTMIPIMLLTRYMPGSVWLFSIGTLTVVLWVIYNFFFLFYLYFKVGKQAPKGTAMRKGSMLIAFGLFMFIMVWISGWAIDIGDKLIDAMLQLVLGVVALSLFNGGFYLLRPRE